MIRVGGTVIKEAGCLIYQKYLHEFEQKNIQALSLDLSKKYENPGLGG